MIRPLWRVALLIGIAGGPAPMAAQQKSPEAIESKQAILMLVTDQPGRLFATEILLGFQQALGDKVADIPIFTEFTGSVRLDSPDIAARRLELLAARYRGQPIRAIIGVASAGMAVAAELREKHFPQAKLILAASNAASLPPDMERAEVLLVPYVPLKAVAFALKLLPETRNLIVISGTSLEDRMNRGAFLDGISALAPKLAIQEIIGPSLAEIRSKAPTFPPHSLAVQLSNLAERQGRVTTNVEVVSAVAERGRIPVVEGSTLSLGRGALGGEVVSFPEVGKDLARIVLSALEDGSAQSGVRMHHAALHRAVDWRQMERFGIKESALPPGTEIRFRKPSFWQEYRREVSIAGAVVAVQALLIAWLLVERRRRARAEVQRNAIERENARNRESVWHLNRVAALGELTASIAHELNQPLAGMLSSAEAAALVLNRPQPDLRIVREALADIIDDNCRAGAIIKQARTMLRRSPPERTPVDLDRVVTATLRLLANDAAARQVIIRARLDSRLPPVHADETQLQQVLLNLLSNAMDALEQMPVGEREVTVSARAEGGVVLMEVRDSGPGISDDRLGRMFEPFHSTKAGGLGLGLSICRSILSACGGDISARNGVEGGAVFLVTLPIRPLEAASGEMAFRTAG